MVKTNIKLTIIIFCLLFSSPSLADQKSPYKFEGEVSRSLSLVTLSYKNTSLAPHCIWQDDFSGIFSGPTFRIENEEGKILDYSGALITRKSDLPRYYAIVYPGDEVKVSFDLNSGYQIQGKGNYKLKYTFPVTNCNWMVNNVERIPGAGILFYFTGNQKDHDWIEKKRAVQELFPNWYKNGFWAVMKPIEFTVK